MRRMGAVGIMLLCALVSGAIAASSAFALPEFAGPFPKPFTSVMKGNSIGETSGGVPMKCKGGSINGEITGPGGGTATLRSSGCTGLAKSTCATVGATEVVSSPLTATLGYVNKAKKEVGLDLAAVSGPFTDFLCANATGVLTAEVTGSLIGKFTRVNKLVTPPGTFKLVFKETSGVQLIQSFEGAPKDTLLASLDGLPPEGAGFAGSATVTFSVPAEVKA